MRFNLIKKVVVGGLITSLCLCCCFLNFNNNVKASAINDYQEENSWFQGATEYTGINDINDLKGKTFTFSFKTIMTLLGYPYSLDIFINILERDYIGVEINEDTHETIQCVDYLQYPYIIYETYDNNNNPSFNLFSFYKESSDNYSFLYLNDTPLNPNTKIQLQGSYTFNINNKVYLPYENITETYDIPLGYYDFYYTGSTTYTLNTSNFNFLNEQNFLDRIDTYNNNFPNNHFLNFYFVFPNTDRYSLTFDDSFVLPEFNNFIYIQPYNANIEDQILSRIEGYNNGYDAGFLDGTTGGGVFSIFTGIFTSVNGILQMEIFPNVKLGYFIWLPLTLGVVGLILTFWRKD